PVVRDTIVAIAREQGAALAEANGDTADAFAGTLRHWTRDDALTIEVLEQGPTRLHFDVTRCRYAEMYRALGIADLGALLSCNRDNALIEGFNPGARLERAQTILGGAPCCTFRYEFPAPPDD
ncbi:MAG: L-2-amino-thiazoline-4-carboxylic acid hydrolase, partial [Rhodobacteraceae bacterium]|nr:L-2-amino-thiazoline-4-carboxylic acid hydrolase [Paracoccaceae bacterium]